MRSSNATALAIACLLVAACTGTDPLLVTEATAGSISASIDGDPFHVEPAHFSRADGRVVIHGWAIPDRSLGIEFPDDGAGTWTIGPGHAVSATVTIASLAWIAGDGTGGGTITVSEFTDDRIAGTFDLTVDAGPDHPRLKVTDGRFEIRF